MRLMDRFLEDTRQERRFLVNLGAEMATRGATLSGQDYGAALAAVEKSIAERDALIEKLAFYSFTDFSVG